MQQCSALLSLLGSLPDRHKKRHGGKSAAHGGKGISEAEQQHEMKESRDKDAVGQVVLVGLTPSEFVTREMMHACRGQDDHHK